MLFKPVKFLAMAAALLAAKTSYADISVGAGYQYGGFVGVKYAHVSDKHVTFASLGPTGGAVGYQQVLSTDRKHLLGITVGAEAISSEDGFAALTYNYHLQGVDSSGWVIGASAGVRREDEASFLGNSGEVSSKGLFVLHFGYQF